MAIAAAEGLLYIMSHQTVDLIVALIAAVIAVLIIGVTALTTRRSGRSPARPD